MGRIEKEIYNQIVNANIGDMICTKASNKMEYKELLKICSRSRDISRALITSQFFDWGTAITHIKKVN